MTNGFPDDIRYMNLAEHVCARHVRYVESGTLAEILSLFVGYALAVHDRQNLEIDRSPQLTLEWLLERSGIDNIYDPQNRTDKIVAVFGSEQDAIVAMREFAATLGYVDSHRPDE